MLNQNLSVNFLLEISAEVSKQLVNSEAMVIITVKGLEKTVDAAIKKEPNNIKVCITQINNRALKNISLYSFVPLKQIIQVLKL